MKKKKIYLTLSILLIFVSLGACTPRDPANTNTEITSQSTSQIFQEATHNTSQPQTNVVTTSSTIPQTTAEKTTTVTKATIPTEASLKTRQRRPYPTETTPEIEKNKELILDILPFDENRALGIAEVLYMLGIDELAEASLVEDDRPADYGPTLYVKDKYNNTYYLLVDQRGFMSQVYSVQDKEPIYAPH